jgi:pyrroloquinoline quinone (PQQ) biosynthesis protein C/mannose-6-phosphate isomerase-like protein (cupin superfamily)
MSESKPLRRTLSNQLLSTVEEPRRRGTDEPSPEAALEKLKARQAAHPIWRSKLLTACRAGHLTKDDYRLIFSQYYLYSQSFTRYLAGVMAACENDLFRAELAKNLWEEGGGVESKRRHAEIFRSFLKEGLGIKIDQIEYLECARLFVREYLDFCVRSHPAAGSAFLSLGTEGIVAKVYELFVEGLTQAGLDDEHLEFFRMHIACDDDHAATLESMMLSYFHEPNWFNLCRKALDHALTLRQQFFDNLFQAVQQRRVGAILDQIQARESLTPVFAEGTSLLNSDTRVRRLLYNNKNERLNIDFQVDAVPFVPEVLDPRIVRIPAHRNNEHHKHAHETIFYILTGTGQVLVDDLKIPVKPGDLVFVPRWAMHQSQNLGDAEMTILAITDFNFTRKAFIGDYLKTARLKHGGARGSTRDAKWSDPDADRD